MSLRASLRRRLAVGRRTGRVPAPAGRRAAADRVWPYWLERRLDPQPPATTPRRPPAGRPGGRSRHRSPPASTSPPATGRRRQPRLAPRRHRRPPRAGHARAGRLVARLVGRRRRPLAPAVARGGRPPAPGRGRARGRDRHAHPPGDAVHQAYGVRRGSGRGRRRGRDGGVREPLAGPGGAGPRGAALRPRVPGARRADRGRRHRRVRGRPPRPAAVPPAGSLRHRRRDGRARRRGHDRAGRRGRHPLARRRDVTGRRRPGRVRVPAGARRHAPGRAAAGPGG